MTLYQYIAVDPNSRATCRGEINAPDAPAARGRLREAGLEVLAVKVGGLNALRRVSLAMTGEKPDDSRRQARLTFRRIGVALAHVIHNHLRQRRLASRAELFDSLATLLSSGIPLLSALESLATSQRSGGRLRLMIRSLAGAISDGLTLSDAASLQPGWFDDIDIEMIRAGEASGTLTTVLSSLAASRQDTEQLGQELLGALLYPAIISVVGVGVVVFLSTKTLPNLTAILTQDGIELPKLTVAVMATGRWLAMWGWLLAASVFALVITGLVLVALRRHAHAPSSPRSTVLRVPKAVRDARLARIASLLESLLVAGVSMVPALRIIARTMPLRECAALKRAADSIEAGADTASSLHRHGVTDAETAELMAVGQSSGELPLILAKIAARLERRAKRSIGRLTTLIEPAAILILATLIGIVVIATILPLLRLQEILQ